MALKQDLARMRAEIARTEAQKKLHPTDEGVKEKLARLRSEYAEMRIAERVQEVVATAPPLSAAQRERLAILLRPERSAEPPARHEREAA